MNGGVEDLGCDSSAGVGRQLILLSEGDLVCLAICGLSLPRRACGQLLGELSSACSLMGASHIQFESHCRRTTIIPSLEIFLFFSEV